MSKKEIIILVVVGILCFIFSFNLTVGTRKDVEEPKKDETKEVEKKEDTKKEDKKEEVLKVGSYTLQYGTYKGVEPTEEGKKEVKLTLTKDGINYEEYEVKDNNIYVENLPMYEVTGNNKLLLMAGSGIEYEFVGE